MAYKRINYGINFKGRTETLEQIFGKDEISPMIMTKVLWDFIKKNKIGSKTK